MTPPDPRYHNAPAAYLVLRRGDSVLLSLRRGTGYEDGRYGLVAGKVEPGESFRACAVREAAEECGLQVRPEDLRAVHVMHRRVIEGEWVDVFFECRDFQGEPENLEPERCGALEWHPLGALPGRVVAYVREALEALRAGESYSEHGFREAGLADAFSDPGFLRKDQYACLDNLEARIALHRRFEPPDWDWFGWVLEQLPTAPGLEVLELGCGSGDLWGRAAGRLPAGWRLTLGDLSGAMVRAAVPRAAAAGRAQGVELDADALPFAPGRFDLVLANHMLYHVADLDRTLGEVRRVLRSGGTLVATTNGSESFAELRALVREVWPEADEWGEARARAVRFGLEGGGEVLRRHFSWVEPRLRQGTLRVTEVAPLLDYVDSWRAPGRGGMPPAVREALVRRLRRHLEGDGEFPITRVSGAFLCRDRGRPPPGGDPAPPPASRPGPGGA